MTILLNEIKSCRICKGILPHPPRPVLEYTPNSKILVVGQAPGRKVHESGIPWNDQSGKHLRKWMNIEKETFYNPELIAIVPMGFCYPRTGKSGDLPPRKECAEAWHEKVLAELPKVELTLLIGQYTQNYFLKKTKGRTLTDTVKNWKAYFPEYIVMPHPSPRNAIWLKKNPWFEQEVVPEL